eukprot:gb/GEZN01004213.1/.p1 GENE.gb/GEZN01004213.1/~~gb/GEZN01004213.1/.p1  ORF type:complete len:531 (+),score=37.79 gb/GEZN01004213.1/:65-1657(+)
MIDAIKNASVAVGAGEGSSLVTILLGCLGCFVILSIFLWRNRARLNPGIDNGTGSWNPLVGHLFEVIHPDVMDNWHEWLLVIHEKHQGKPFQICPWPSFHNFIYSINPATAEYVLKTNFQNYRLPKYRVDLFSELFGEGIFASNGPQWRLHRKAASHIVTTRQLQDFMTKVFVRHATVALCNKIAQYEQQGVVVDLQELFFRFTMDCFSEIAFGEDLKTVQSYGSHDDGGFALFFDRSQYNLTRRIFTPWWSFNRFLGLGDEPTINKDISALNQFVDRIVQRRKKEAFDRDDLLSHYIRFSRISGNKTITDGELRDTVTNFIIAGRDTTACLLSWLFYQLSQHPSIEHKLRQELARTFGEFPEFDVERIYKQAAELHYLDACLFEVLRLHPSVPDDVREAVNDDILPDGSQIKAKQILPFNPYVYGRSTYIWGESAGVFDPQRFLDPQGIFVRPSSFKLPSFSAGPRLCLGRSLALLEAKLVVAVLLSRFRFAAPLTGACEGKYQVTIILRIKNGLPLLVRSVSGYTQVE